MGVKVVADLGAFIDHDVRMQHSVFADGDMLAHYREGADGGSVANLRRRCHRCLWMDAWRRVRRLVEQSQRPREIVIGIRRYQARRLGLWQGLFYQDRSRARVFYLRRVLGVGQERQIAGTRSLYPCHAGDLDVRVAVQRAAEPSRQIAQANPLDGRHLICIHVDGFIVSGGPMWNRGDSQAPTLVKKARQQPIRQ